MLTGSSAQVGQETPSWYILSRTGRMKPLVQPDIFNLRARGAKVSCLRPHSWKQGQCWGQTQVLALSLELSLQILFLSPPVLSCAPLLVQRPTCILDAHRVHVGLFVCKVSMFAGRLPHIFSECLEASSIHAYPTSCALAVPRIA